ncbi:MAG TPA: tetratricopeptide repeat protein [Gemmatimonadaceae bacterium]|nr:tetratricopeptide repeat protein [Gemmatimonadaceae bacterium]
MSTLAQRSARAALDAARPAVARLDVNRGSEDLAADLIETWGAVEDALRSLVGSSVLSGQALIREARQRQLIDFDQANSLAELLAVHDRVHNTTYRPTQADINATRTAFLKLDSALMGDTGVESPRVTASAPAAPAATAPIIPPPATVTTAPVGTRRRVPVAAWVVAAIVIVAILGVIAYYAFGNRGTSGSLQAGITAYQAGQREVAVSDFNKAAREDPKNPVPHIYLGRMAREVGNYPLATQELTVAIQDDPTNALALREMGANLLTQGNYDLARNFYVKAVRADPTDKVALGYLGCTLTRLNRASEAATFLTRAGPGPWSNCTPVAPGTQPANNPGAPVPGGTLTNPPGVVPRP